jgi:TM2 domain-containing membrane protein YozV
MQKAYPAIAYLCWCLCFFGVCGAQRLYSGRIVSGLLYLFTFGFCGIGQLIDLALIPGMVHKRNVYLRRLYATPPGADAAAILNTARTPERQLVQPQATNSNSPMQKLLQIAQQHGGCLSSAQVALYTGLEPEQVKALLKEAMKAGYADVYNDPTSGAIRYRFDV